jgi:hypothetical protein
MPRKGAQELFQHKRYPNYRNVSSMETKNGVLIIKIDSVSNRGLYAIWLTVTLGVFVGGCWIFVPPLLRVNTLMDALAVLLPIGFLLLWCGIMSRVALERLCAIELFAGKGIFRWSYRVLRWGKNLEGREEDVTAVVAKARWYGNRLNVTMAGRTYSLGDLMDEDMTIIARELRRALPAVSDTSA